MHLLSAFLLIVFNFWISDAHAEVTVIEVEAGNWSRAETLVHFPLPGFKNKTLGLLAKGK
tara:strand:+ start:355 stop:534 length:180 start_codon:yes stop_codon:yes gene_type:complete